MAAGVRVTGLRDWQKRLRRLPRHVASKILTRALTKAAKPIVRAIKRSAPRGPTGNLRRRVGSRKARRLRPGELAARIIKARAPHAWIVEHGTKQRFRKRIGGKFAR